MKINDQISCQVSKGLLSNLLLWHRRIWFEVLPNCDEIHPLNESLISGPASCVGFAGWW